MAVTTNPLVTGIPAGGSGGSADTANADADADFAATKIGSIVNARLAAYERNTGDWERLQCEFTNQLTGTGHNAVNALATHAIAFGRDISDNTLRAIEARASASAQAVSLYRLLIDASSRSYSATGAQWESDMSLLETSSTQGVKGVYQARAAGYWASRQGRRFTATTEGTAVTVSNGFTATAPRFTLEAGATNELIIRRIKLACLAAGTTNLQYRIVLDSDARYSSGGTTGTVGARVNMNGGSATAAGFTFHYGAITATAADSDEREIEYGTIVNVTGNEKVLEFEDGLIVPASGTLLIYLMDAGATGTVAVNVALEEANIQ